MHLKMVLRDSTRTVTYFYVRNMVMFHIFFKCFMSSLLSLHPQLLLACKEIIESLVDLYFSIFLIVVFCAFLNKYPPKMLSMMLDEIDFYFLGNRSGQPYIPKRMVSMESHQQLCINQTILFTNFILRMLKVGDLDILMESKGDIHSNCSIANLTSSSYQQIIDSMVGLEERSLSSHYK